MAHTKLFAAVAATALALTAGASTATAFDPEHQNARAGENCAANVAKQFELGLTGGNGAKSGISDPLAPTNCNKSFGAPGHG
jgi:uncharacterized membrane protein